MNNCQYCNRDISQYCGGEMKECANCWEVMGRLDTFLESDFGRRFVEKHLNDAKKNKYLGQMKGKSRGK